MKQRPEIRTTLLSLVLAAGALAWAPPLRADTATLTAARDTTFTSQGSATSNGNGIYGCIGQNGVGASSRGLYYFDVSSIPFGSFVTDVQFDLWLAPNAQGQSGVLDLHTVLQDWGEGNSDAPQGECQGTVAELNDTTWDYTFYNPPAPLTSTPWSVAGGNYVALPSASLFVTNTAGMNTWSSAQLVTDVQFWIDNAGAANHGWLLKKAVETGSGDALRFKSRANATLAERPRLRITFDPPATIGACCLLGETCSELSASACLTQDGTFQGAATSCAATVCVDPIGACCDPAGTCSEDTQLACTGGVYQGDGQTCAMTACPIVLTPFVDALPIPAVAQPGSGSAGGAASYTIAMREVQQSLHRDLPPTTVWGYGDGPAGATYPGPTIEASTGQPVTIEFVNDLRDTAAPGDPKPLRTDHYLAVAGTAPPPECHIHGAEDKAKAVVHLHGGHVPAVFDGYPEDNYDPGNSLVFTYPNNQRPATIWYHDHALGITRLNVYMGLAGFYLIRDAFEGSLGLPAGEYEIPLVIQDRSFNTDGTLSYPADIQDVFFGDFVAVNGKVWPYLDVKQGKYRFRLLNGSGSRTYTMTLDRLDQPGNADLSFTQIGTDGGLIEAPLTLDEITLAPAERADVIVDFAGLPAGTEVVLANSAPAPFPGTPGIGVLPEVMKFVVSSTAGHTAPVPATLRAPEVLDEFDSIRSRDFTLQKSGDACGGIWKINDLTWDDITEYPQLGTTEVWRFINPSTVTHPMHMHLVFFQVLDRVPIGGGAPVPPDPNEVGWKDTVRADPGMITRVIARFEDYSGKFAYHCHILEHEDHEMMRQFWSVDGIGVTMSGTVLSWTAQPGALGYDVVRGDLGELRASGGNFALSTVTDRCMASFTGGTTMNDATPLAPGEGFWYLVRSNEGAGNATYDSGSPFQVDYRDDEIALSGNDCP
jgi:spore coat protein A